MPFYQTIGFYNSFLLIHLRANFRVDNSQLKIDNRFTYWDACLASMLGAGLLQIGNSVPPLLKIRTFGLTDKSGKGGE
jgi:hypothetical protein